MDEALTLAMTTVSLLFVPAYCMLLLKHDKEHFTQPISIVFGKALRHLDRFRSRSPSCDSLELSTLPVPVLSVLPSA